MANWSTDDGWQNSHVNHQSGTNIWRMPHCWQSRQNIPKTQVYHQPKQSNIASRNRRNPPTLLRLDSAGESVEEYPSPSRRTCYSSVGRPNPAASHSHSFLRLGNIFSKVSQPLRRTTPCLAKTSDRGQQGEVDLDSLVDKFTSNCDMEHKRPMATADQEVPSHVKRPGQPAPAMTFNGGPYITCPSQDNTPRIFPAYYRFLNLAHFHPYSTATRFDRTNVPPFRQPRPRWGDGISQFHHRHKQTGLASCQGRQTMNLGAGLLGHGQKSYPQQGKQYCGTRAKNNNRMMQNKQPMSHPSRHSSNSNTTKTASSHGVTETKRESTGFFGINNQFETSQVNPAFFPDEFSSSLIQDSSQKKASSKSNGHPCNTACVSLAENTSTLMKACSNRAADKTAPNHEGHLDTCTPEKNLSDTVSKNFATNKFDKALHICSPSSTCKKNEKCNKTRTIENQDASKNLKHELDQSEVVVQEQITKHAAESVSTPNTKQMHSSIAFLLGDYATESAAGSYDSDFSDADEEVLNEEIDNETLELFESFHSSDPYNPLYGWKCLSKSTAGQSAKDQLATSEMDETNKDSTLNFNDSGVSIVEQALGDVASSPLQTDESEDGEDSESSDDWSDSGCDEEEQRVWDSLNRCNDPYDPINGWRCDEPSLLHKSKDIDSITPEQDVGDTDSITQSEKDISQVPLLKNNHQPHCETQDGAKLASVRHPSVSFILGDDDDSSDDEDDTDGFQDSFDSSTEHEELWQSFETSSDPYDPINGWRCQTSSLLHKSVSSPSDLYKGSEQQDEEAPVKSLFSSDARSDLPLHTPDYGTPSGNVPLRQSSSTGCLKKIRQRTLQYVKDKISKKVHFCEKEPIVISPQVPMWEEEYIEARRGHWEEYARDRCRFKRRIQQAELNIAPCFTPERRVKVFQKQCSNF